MKTKKIYLFLFGVSMLTLGCGSNLDDEAIDPETLNASIIRLNDRSDDAYSSYYLYEKNLTEKYGDNYASSTFDADPIGFSYNENLVSPGENAPKNYAVNLASGSVSYSFSDFKAEDQGRYYLYLEYFVPETFASEPAIKVTINGSAPFDEASKIVLPMSYEDNVTYTSSGKKDFDSYVTRYNDQMSPTQKRVLTWEYNGLNESTYSTSDPLQFEITGDSPVITIENLDSDYFYVGKLSLVPVSKYKTYSEYLDLHAFAEGSESFELNAVDYAYKNSNDMTLSNEQTPSATPYEDGRKLLNVTSGWDNSGQSITWKINTSKAGYYPITVHYYNDNDNFPLYRKIEINGEVPFDEMLNYKFPSTGSNYANETLHDEDGNKYYFYLKEGENTLTLTATTEPLLEVYTNLMAIYDDINDFAIKIRKITGSSVDSYRVYKLTEYFAETLSVLKAYKNVIVDSYQKLKKIVGNDKSSAALSYFQRMNELINEFIEEPDDLPLKLTKFSSGDSCLAKLIADTATTLESSNMVLDTIYVTNNDSDIRKANSSWVASLKSSFVTLGQTFTSDKYKTILADGELNIWSGRSQAYNDILQTFADNYFTPYTKCAEFPDGIKVNIRQMPSEDNLIYAYAANSVPDLVLGINSGRAYEFALRGDAAYPLSDFDDTWKYTNNYWGFESSYWSTAQNMPHGQLLSMLYNDKFYSLPESTSIELLYSRDDIMNVMGDGGGSLEIPSTWQELIGSLYRIQSYGMNFYYPTSASGSLKALANTSQFILQNNGTILTDSAYETNLRSDETYEGLKLLTDLYTIYALPTEVGSFYNHFRYGTYPLGISDIGMYLSLKYVAPELLGKWSVHEIPGIEQEPNEDGTYTDLNGDGEGDEVSRWYISNGSSAMIFNNSKYIDEAWLFLKWWMSEDIQLKFTDALQSTYGPSVLWVSANLDAMEQLPIDSNVREIALKQVNWIIDLQQIPGQYMLERGLSDIWNTVVFGTSSSGESTGKVTIGEAIDLEKVIVDREIQRKMEEFGYYDTTEGKGVKDYVMRSYAWVDSCFTNYANGTKGGNASSPYCPI